MCRWLFCTKAQKPLKHNIPEIPYKSNSIQTLRKSCIACNKHYGSRQISRDLQRGAQCVNLFSKTLWRGVVAWGWKEGLQRFCQVDYTAQCTLDVGTHNICTSCCLKHFLWHFTLSCDLIELALNTEFLRDFGRCGNSAYWRGSPSCIRGGPIVYYQDL